MADEKFVFDDVVIFSPDNEPYLGLKSLYVLDVLISAALKENFRIAPKSQTTSLSEHQKMASQVIPQALSIALSIRELIRQGYLFGGHVLVRSLAERSTILLYLHNFPDEIEKWNRGWQYRDAPGLAKMFDELQKKGNFSPKVPGSSLTASMNSLVHGKPDSAFWNLILLDHNNLGHATSKILNRPDLCDELCNNVISWLAIIPAMMNAYFSDERVTET